MQVIGNTQATPKEGLVRFLVERTPSPAASALVGIGSLARRCRR